MTAPALIACSHGTRNPQGRAAIAELVAQVRQQRAGLEVHEAFVDVQHPTTSEVVSQLPPGRHAVVVPTLLATGVHVKQDIAAATTHPRVVAAPPLGPHPLLVEILADRLGDVGLRPGDAIMLAAAGSSDPEAARATEWTATHLREVLDRGGWGDLPVTVGYGAGAKPRLAEAVTAARASGARRVVAVSYLLAPGFFHGLVARCGADVVTSPLTPDPRLAQVVLERYDAAR